MAWPADPIDSSEVEPGEGPDTAAATAFCGSGALSEDAVGDGPSGSKDREPGDGRDAIEAGLSALGGAEVGGAVDTELPVRAELSCRILLCSPANSISNACAPA